MNSDPYELRARAGKEPLSAFELGRALSHLAKRRHFKGRELETAEATRPTRQPRRRNPGRQTT